jgi:molybdopterin-guanine dinucleotide biosynthesis protein A
MFMRARTVSPSFPPLRKSIVPPLSSKPTSRFAGLLLAGGHSQRMGRDKAQLDWQGRPLGDHQAATLAMTGASPLFVSCRPIQKWTPRDFSRLEDRSAGGALAAFVEALTAIAGDIVLVLAIDLPLVEAGWLEAIGARAVSEGVSVVPLHAGRFEPFAAAWHRSAFPVLHDALARNQSLQQTCAELQERKLLHALAIDAAAAASFSNLNTPEDAARLGCTV